MTVSFRQPLPLLDLDVLRTFVAIAETGNFSTAAEAVFRTPSAVSMQVKKLEEQLGTVLFLRDARSVSLTEGGEVLLGYARRMITLSNEAVSRVIMPDMRGVVRLGAPEDIGERLLPSVLKRFADSHPGITVDVTIDMSSRLVGRVEEQRLDLALINCSKASHHEKGELVLRDKLVWAGVKCGTAHLRDPLPISIWEDGCIWRAEALTALEKQRRPYRIAYLSGHTMAQRAAVLADLAIAPLPSSNLTSDMKVLGEKDGLPELGFFDIRLLTASGRASGPVAAVTESIHHFFGDLPKAA